MAWVSLFEKIGFKTVKQENIGFPEGRDIDVPQALFVLETKDDSASWIQLTQRRSRRSAASGSWRIMSRSIGEVFLARLLFSARHGNVSEWFADFSDRLEAYVRIEWLVLVWFVGAALFSVQTASVPLTFGSLLLAFFTWRRNQR